MAKTMAKVRAFTGPALLSHGFRPFFLFGALWAGVAIGLWLPILQGAVALPTAFSPVEWHVHELVFGFVPAIVAGFLLTAVPNWTGRLPVVGIPLLMLFLTWVAGRGAILCSAWLGQLWAALIDTSFLVALALVMTREIIAGGNWRNLRVIVGVGLLTAGNALFHLETLAAVGSGHGTRLGIAAIMLLIALIGGRIIPSFTRNWLANHNPGLMPISFDRLDAIVIAVSGLALITWVLMPAMPATGVLALLACVLNAIRLSRWAGGRTLSEPLVIVLHIAYAFVPLGFLLLGASILLPEILPPSAALHAWTAGAIGLMTLAVMTRASLGHTGRPLTASLPITLLYVAVGIAASARIAAAFAPLREMMLPIAAAAWVAAFGGFVIIYAPMLLRKRKVA